MSRERFFGWTLSRLVAITSESEVAAMLGEDLVFVQCWLYAEGYWAKGGLLPSGFVLPKWQYIDPMCDLLHCELQARGAQ
jgi:hypothetical protein